MTTADLHEFGSLDRGRGVVNFTDASNPSPLRYETEASGRDNFSDFRSPLTNSSSPHRRRGKRPASASISLCADPGPASRPTTNPTSAPAAVYKDKTGAVYPSIAELAGESGDAKAGAAVYRDAMTANCIRCHQIGDEGGMIGPPLTTIGDKLSKSQIYEAIFTPSASILMSFENWLIKTKDGEVQEGLLTEDTDDHVTLLDVTGMYHDIPKDQVVTKKQQPISIMPEGLNAAITKQDMLNLVEYLTTLKNQ